MTKKKTFVKKSSNNSLSSSDIEFDHCSVGSNDSVHSNGSAGSIVMIGKGAGADKTQKQQELDSWHKKQNLRREPERKFKQLYPKNRLKNPPNVPVGVIECPHNSANTPYATATTQNGSTNDTLEKWKKTIHAAKETAHQAYSGARTAYGYLVEATDFKNGAKGFLNEKADKAANFTAFLKKSLLGTTKKGGDLELSTINNGRGR